MFTGLVRSVGTVDLREPYAKGIRFGVEVPELAAELAAGESVAVDGVCQTVVQADERRIEFEAIRTTLSRTTLGDWEPGRRVNLEPPLHGTDRFGGHLVQGHVDGVAEVVSVEEAGETVFVRIGLPTEVAAVTVLYGSLAVDGVSMTVNRLDGDVAELAIIPYTWTHTAFPRLRPGGRVNVEADLIGKYVRKLLQPYFERPEGGGPIDPAAPAEPPKPTGQATES
jgi:riboflavin synthase